MLGKNVVIVGCKRTPIGLFMGALSSFTAPHLGSIAIRGALATTRIDPSEVEEVFMGNVLQAAVGQAPARQAALNAGLAHSTICTTINKGCASGMKSVILGTEAIASGNRKTVIAGGMESMTGCPHYSYIRESLHFSHNQFLDGILVDGYTEQVEQ